MREATVVEGIVPPNSHGLGCSSSMSNLNAIANSPQSAVSDRNSDISLNLTDAYAVIKISLHNVPVFTPRKKLRVVTNGAGL
jgi:hypothetical protein